MTFREATDVLTSSVTVTLAKLATEFKVELNTIARARMKGENARRPPDDWERVLANVAHKHASELRQRANELDTLGHRLTNQREKNVEAFRNR